MNCKNCDVSLTYNEIGLNKKILGKTVTEFFCKQCLAKHLNVTVARLDEKQKQYLESGCCLFTRESN